jgi:hypothetical protein
MSKAKFFLMTLLTLLPFKSFAYIAKEQLDIYNDTIGVDKFNNYDKKNKISDLILSDINPNIKSIISIEEALLNLNTKYPYYNDKEIELIFENIIDLLIENKLILNTNKDIILMSSNNLSVLPE